ncbi:hypothetical protein ABZ464_51465 [Streptomyces sp. NPDC005820]|uniref:hypothetical protein n=1 Tax=Streptomyces sp. NPDC005820 TaxID=3157069 RepID=UPI0033D311D2
MTGTSAWLRRASLCSSWQRVSLTCCFHAEQRKIVRGGPSACFSRKNPAERGTTGDDSKAFGPATPPRCPELPGDRSPDAFWATVEERLATGRMWLLFVADRIPLELWAIVEG